MVVLNKIYTKTGDAGETALGNGARVAKHSMRVTAYGTVDEANATVGMARLHASGDMDAQLAAIQNDLFDLGADLCRPDMEKDAEAEYPPLRMAESQVERLEAQIDAMTEILEPLAVIHFAWRLSVGSALAFVPYRIAPRRAVNSRVGHNGISEPFCSEILEPPVRLVLCRITDRQ